MSLSLLYYKCHEINPNHGGSYICSPDWVKKVTINPINIKNKKCFQYPITVALNHEEIKKIPQRITKIKAFINKYDCKGINFKSGKDDWKKFEKNNRIIALNVCYAKK